MRHTPPPSYSLLSAPHMRGHSRHSTCSPLFGLLYYKSGKMSKTDGMHRRFRLRAQIIQIKNGGGGRLMSFSPLLFSSLYDSLFVDVPFVDVPFVDIPKGVIRGKRAHGRINGSLSRSLARCRTPCGTRRAFRGGRTGRSRSRPRSSRRTQNCGGPRKKTQVGF